jgi:hypothetical protein
MLCEFAVGTGLRWGELVGMHRVRVDTANLRILVQEVFDKETNEFKPYPKGRKRADHIRAGRQTRRLDGRAPPGALSHAAPCGQAVSRIAALSELSWDVARLQQLPAPSVGRRHRGGWPGRGHPARSSAYVRFMAHPVQAGHARRVGHPARSQGPGHHAAVRALWRGPLERCARSVRARDVGPRSRTRTLCGAIARLAEEKPEWAAVAAALGGTDARAARGDSAPDLPQETDQEEGGKIIQLDRFRSSIG